MLIRYKKAFEKIAMGLLSFMPNEKDIKKLTETIQSYETDDNWILYLWKKNDEYVGIIGLVLNNETATIQHVSVVPSYRGEGVATEMVQEVAELGQYENVRATDETREFVQKCIDCTDENKEKADEL
ncbi:GNAT family N-acetyltransferase [Lysinibacillus sp. NPDC096418]|uniref:GNAT family N-acetyltransferase n=1 Tax=Lysinibacillus sp. NPDC096418 TaxID=3364138 RepID=UPI0037FE3E4D